MVIEPLPLQATGFVPVAEAVVILIVLRLAIQVALAVVLGAPGVSRTPTVSDVNAELPV
jgi:hypothetical protein